MEYPPHWGDLLVELDRRDDPRLAHVLQRRTPAQALAALVLMEFERGNAAGGRIAYEAMMLNYRRFAPLRGARAAPPGATKVLQ